MCVDYGHKDEFCLNELWKILVPIYTPLTPMADPGDHVEVTASVLMTKSNQWFNWL